MKMSWKKWPYAKTGASKRVMCLDDHNGKRIYMIPLIVGQNRLTDYPHTIEIRTLCEMRFANNSRQGKALAMAGLQDGLLH